jgi:hypothetical protein
MIEVVGKLYTKLLGKEGERVSTFLIAVKCIKYIKSLGGHTMIALDDTIDTVIVVNLDIQVVKEKIKQTLSVNII